MRIMTSTGKEQRGEAGQKRGAALQGRTDPHRLARSGQSWRGEGSEGGRQRQTHAVRQSRQPQPPA
eukprot:5278078-Heterocapsa_arctica.AAC.1